MMTAWPRWLAWVLLLFPLVAVVAGTPSDEEIERLVKMLGSNRFQERQEATQRLTEIGEPALAALCRVTDPLEVRRRAEGIIAITEHKLHGQPLVLSGHRSHVYAMAVSLDGKRLLTGSSDSTLRLWDTATASCLRTFKGHTSAVVAAALSPDGRRVLSGSLDHSVRLWDADTGEELARYTGHSAGVRGVAFGPDGQALSAGGATLHLHDLDTGKTVRTFSGHTNMVNSIAYRGKGKLAATSSTDGSVRLWDLESGKVVWLLPGASSRGCNNLCFAPDGKRLLSVDADDRIAVWDVETGKELKRFADTSAYCVALSPDGKYIVSGGVGDGSVRLWDADTGRPLYQYAGHSGAVLAVAFFPDGKRVASAGYDGTARIWSVPKRIWGVRK